MGVNPVWIGINLWKLLRSGNAQLSPEGCTGVGLVKKKLKESGCSLYNIVSVVKLFKIKRLVNDNHFVNIYTIMHTWNFTLSPIILISDNSK